MGPARTRAVWDPWLRQIRAGRRGAGPRPSTCTPGKDASIAHDYDGEDKKRDDDESEGVLAVGPHKRIVVNPQNGASFAGAATLTLCGHGIEPFFLRLRPTRGAALRRFRSRPALGRAAQTGLATQAATAAVR